MICLLMICAVLLSGCSADQNSADTQTETEVSKVDMTKWQYNAENDVYWQVGIVYCSSPADKNYENLGIYVPGAYMTGTANSDGTYTCEINPSGTVGGLIGRLKYPLLYKCSHNSTVLSLGPTITGIIWLSLPSFRANESICLRF